jgi:predicted nucleotidyltransferase
MPYISQVGACLHESRRYFALAEQAAANWPYCGSTLARALECATCAVFIARGEPHAPEKKMHRFFDERLAPQIDPSVAVVVQLVWEREGQGPPATGVQLLLDGCEKAIDYFAALAANPPPAGWEPLPAPEPVGWDGLAEDERRFLQRALAAARRWAAGARLMLFGSRAAGAAGPDSDYDLLFIFPNHIAEWQRGQARGSVSSLDRSVRLSIESASEDEWHNPPEVSRVLIERVKATGIEIPPSLPGTRP